MFKSNKTNGMGNSNSKWDSSSGKSITKTRNVETVTANRSYTSKSVSSTKFESSSKAMAASKIKTNDLRNEFFSDAFKFSNNTKNPYSSPSVFKVQKTTFTPISKRYPPNFLERSTIENQYKPFDMKPLRSAFDQKRPVTTTTITTISSYQNGNKNNVKSYDNKPVVTTYTSPYTTRSVTTPSPFKSPSLKSPGNVTPIKRDYEVKKYITPSPLVIDRKTPQISYGPLKNSIVSSQPVNKMPLKSKLKPGALYVFNQERFLKADNNRIGSGEDVKKLKKTFGTYRLDINIFDDMTVSQIQNKIKTIQRKDFSRHSCVVFALLSHGLRHEELMAKDKNFNIDDEILFPVLQNTTLMDKPKIIIVQACKGDFDLRYPQTDAACLKPPVGAPTEIIKCYSTFEGFVSYRGKDGSIFIQTVCEMLETHGKTKCIETIMKMVIEQVKTTTANRQVPFISGNLTKPFVFGDYV